MSELANNLYYVESDARKSLRELEDTCAYLVRNGKLEWFQWGATTDKLGVTVDRVEELTQEARGCK